MMYDDLTVNTSPAAQPASSQAAELARDRAAAGHSVLVIRVMAAGRAYEVVPLTRAADVIEVTEAEGWRLDGMTAYVGASGEGRLVLLFRRHRGR
jgi:hypothetical protein